MEPKISYFVDTCRCPLRGYRSYNNSNNLFVITLKPYEHIVIRGNREKLMVHHNIIILLTTAFSQLQNICFWLSIAKVEMSCSLKRTGPYFFQVQTLCCWELIISQSCFIFPLIESLWIISFILDFLVGQKITENTNGYHYCNSTLT